MAAAQGCVSFAGLSYFIDLVTSPKNNNAPKSDEAILNNKP